MHTSFKRSIAGLVLIPLLLSAADAPPRQDRFAGLIEDPSVAMRKFQVAPGLKVDLFAAEPMVQNPVSFCFDNQGRVFLVESFRRRTSVFDIRGHRTWLETDFSFRTVEDRANFFRRTIVPSNETDLRRLTGSRRGGYRDFNEDGVIDWRDLEVETERIRLLEDTDGDGLADRAEIFAEDFTNIVAGVAAGIMAHDGDIYFTCIPDLWRLRDRDGDGRADERQALIHGFGVHIAFGGHDMHGVIMGPDGKLYWSIADRGTSTNLWSRITRKPAGLTPELLADTGCIFRSQPDGTELEVVAWGLRNPQELAFDDYGNLFTADNNGDGGDPARWHYIVEGVDAGWRLGWQWLPKMGAWNAEKLWALPDESTAAYLIPPLAHIGHGPAGLARYPGTGLPDRFRDHFFLCDFPGGVLMWTNRVKGAYFEAGPVQKFFGDLGPTDIAFAPGGGAYVSDWFNTFEKTDRGRIYRIHDPAMGNDPTIAETKNLLAADFKSKSIEDLIKLLHHADRRVRLQAQFDLARRRAMNALHRLAATHAPTSETNQLIARLHAIWAIGQIGATTESIADAQQGESRYPAGTSGKEAARQSLLFLSGDSHEEIREAAVRVLPNVDRSLLPESLAVHLNDPALRVRVQAALSLARLESPIEPGPVFEMLRVSPADDPYVLHAAVMALSRPEKTAGLANATQDPSMRVRMASLLALRRLQHSSVTNYLADEGASIVLEAARAINDHPIRPAMDSLANFLNEAAQRAAEVETLASSSAGLFPDMVERAELWTWTLRRTLNANFRLGQAHHAERLAQFAANENHRESLRLEALEMLSEWAQPASRDKIIGLYRPVSPTTRDPKSAADALSAVLSFLILDADAEIRQAATHTAEVLQVPLPDAMDTLANQKLASDLRLSALRSMLKESTEDSTKALDIALHDSDPSLRMAALQWKTRQEPSASLPLLKTALAHGTIPERQNALQLLSGLNSPAGDGPILEWMHKLLHGDVPPELQLDILNAARERSTDSLNNQLSRYEASLSNDDPLASFRVALQGGNAARGRVLFYERQEAGCFRCHKINGLGGEVGPELSTIGERQNRTYLLESIVTPNKVIAPGYETLLVVTKQGTTYAGQIARETADILEINSPEDGLVTLSKSDIASRSIGLSAMPPELATLLTASELRDLIEFLAQLK